MLDALVRPDLWFLDSLVECSAKVLARSGDGDLFFVGRSLDSMFDLISGSVAGFDGGPALARVPFSFSRPDVPVSARKWRRLALSPGQRAAGRQLLAANGITPRALARRGRPATFVDVVHDGVTFAELFQLLDEWVDESREPWDVVRRKLRFVGVTVKRETSPKTWRWQQHAAWTRRLPAAAVTNVSLEYSVWSYFGDHQTKLTRSFRPDRWLAEADEPNRDEKTRLALAEAVALVSYGRTAAGRKALARATAGEPTRAEPWLHALVGRLNTGN